MSKETWSFYDSSNNNAYIYTRQVVPNGGIFDNAVCGDEFVPDTSQSKLWPCWDVESSKWVMVEDHRKRTFPDGTEELATEYWLPEDTFDSQARTVEELGPLPKGYSLTRPKKNLDTLKKEKYTEIINKANAVKSLLDTKFSIIEELTWTVQEAGARSILGKKEDCTTPECFTIFDNPIMLEQSENIVIKLAEIDTVSPEEFSNRILNNVEVAKKVSHDTLCEQRAFETALNSANTVEDIEAIEVVYSAMKLLENQDG